MRNIYDIARAELQSLFYSPIAWLILIIFTFQSAGIFGGHLAGMVMGKELGYSLSDLTYKLFVDQWERWNISSNSGIFVFVHSSVDHGSDEPGVEQWFHQIVVFFTRDEQTDYFW